MKYYKILTFGLLIILCSSFYNIFGDPRSKRTKIADKISSEVIKNIREKYGLTLFGIGNEGPGEKYIGFSFDFDYPYILTKDQGRALLVASMEEALYVFNSYPEFRPYMKNYPFTDENIDINIFIRLRNNSIVYYPNVRVFSFYNGKLSYSIETPQSENSGKYYSEERETYEEAIKILAEQQKNNPPNYSPFPFNNPN